MKWKIITTIKGFETLYRERSLINEIMIFNKHLHNILSSSFNSCGLKFVDTNLGAYYEFLIYNKNMKQDPEMNALLLPCEHCLELWQLHL